MYYSFIWYKQYCIRCICYRTVYLCTANSSYNIPSPIVLYA
nr:MAG TPA: hypothetical protein [Caudoviricetes sp.]